MIKFAKIVLDLIKNSSTETIKNLQEVGKSVGKINQSIMKDMDARNKETSKIFAITEKLTEKLEEYKKKLDGLRKAVEMVIKIGQKNDTALTELQTNMNEVQKSILEAVSEKLDESSGKILTGAVKGKSIKLGDVLGSMVKKSPNAAVIKEINISNKEEIGKLQKQIKDLKNSLSAETSERQKSFKNKDKTDAATAQLVAEINKDIGAFLTGEHIELKIENLNKDIIKTLKNYTEETAVRAIVKSAIAESVKEQNLLAKIKKLEKKLGNFIKEKPTVVQKIINRYGGGGGRRGGTATDVELSNEDIDATNPSTTEGASRRAIVAFVQSQVQQGGGTSITAAEIKTAYESNADTNAFTDADKTKLDGLQQVTDTDHINIDKYARASSPPPVLTAQTYAAAANAIPDGTEKIWKCIVRLNVVGTTTFVSATAWAQHRIDESGGGSSVVDGNVYYDTTNDIIYNTYGTTGDWGATKYDVANDTLTKTADEQTGDIPTTIQDLEILTYN